MCTSVSELAASTLFSEVGGGLERRNREEQKRERRRIEMKDERRRGAMRREGMREDVRRGGRDTRSTLTIYMPTPMANGNYICFNY